MKASVIIPMIGALVVMAACTPPPPDVPPPQKSATCEVREQYASTALGFGVREPTAIRMNNDGEWCWYDRATISGGTRIGVQMRVTTPPSNGTILITVQEKATRVGYKPNVGFTGTDEFSVMNELLKLERPYVVTVVP